MLTVYLNNHAFELPENESELVVWKLENASDKLLCSTWARQATASASSFRIMSLVLEAEKILKKWLLNLPDDLVAHVGRTQDAVSIAGVRLFPYLKRSE